MPPVLPPLASIDLSDVKWMALTLRGEARGEPLDGMVAVGQVIMERVRDPRYPKTIRDVCLQAKQFSCWNEDDANYPVLVEWALTGLDPLKRVWTPDIKEAHWVADGVARGYVRQLVPPHTCHYHAAHAHPGWAAGKMPCRIIAHHFFYNDVA